MTFRPALGSAVCLLAVLSGPRVAAAAGEAPRNRAESIRALCARLGIGEGACIADIGCGNGEDAVHFARIVGARGAVFAEEIDSKRVESVRDRARKEGLANITPVLGQAEDPRVPDGSLDLAYMHYAFHHFAKPRQMLRNLWRDLRPGGFLVVVDREKGPPRDLVPLERRERSHHWVGETTVVRQAREEGFEFVDELGELWHERAAFVLVFRRPLRGEAPRGDPDLPPPLDARAVIAELSVGRSPPPAVAAIAFGRGRAVLRDLREAAGPEAVIADICLEEWAESEDEAPPEPADGAAKVLRTQRGALAIPEGLTFQAVVFADAYHLLWRPDKLLGALAERLSAGGAIAGIDRAGPEEAPLSLASHRRRIAPARVRRELEAAGFGVTESAAAASSGRFVLIARPAPVVRETEEAIEIDTGALLARVRKKGYVSGVEAGMLDRRTGARSLGFGLHVMDFLMGPGWRDDGYSRDAKLHGDLPKHYEEGPQICTQAAELPAAVIKGPGFVAVKLAFTFTEGYEGREAGSRWEQTLVFPAGARYFLSAEEIVCAHAVPGLFYRIDMPGHLRHQGGDTFSEIFLSYRGAVAAAEFDGDFGPDEKFLYRRGAEQPPERFIRAYRTKLPDGAPGPWLAGMTLDPALVAEAWCHQRGYVCFIQELWGRDVAAGEKIGAAYIVGFFDSIADMEAAYDGCRGARAIAVSEAGYRVVK